MFVGKKKNDSKTKKKTKISFPLESYPTPQND